MCFTFLCIVLSNILCYHKITKMQGPVSDITVLCTMLKLSLVPFADRLFGLAGKKIELHSRPEKTEVSKNRMEIDLYVLVSCLVNWQIKLIGATLFYDLAITCGIAREVKDHVYVKPQTRICTTWPSFPFTCRLLFIISTQKLVVSLKFLSIRIVWSCFYMLILYLEKFSTWIRRLAFAVYVKLDPSTVCSCVRQGLKLN